MFLNKKIHILIFLISSSFVAFSQSGKNDILLTNNVDHHLTFKQNPEDNLFNDSTIIADDTLVFDDLDDPRKPRKSIYNLGNKSNAYFSLDEKENIAFSKKSIFGNTLDQNKDSLGFVLEDNMPMETTKDEKIELSQKANLQIKAYPNPVVKYLTIVTSLEIDELWLTNINGQRMEIKIIDQKIDMSNLAEGCYILSIRVDSMIENNKIFVKR
jgi:hypothetical protein